MYVPYIPNTSVVNLKIIFNNTELSLENLKKTVIPNIEIYNIEDCLINILKSNRTVTFNTVAYSKNDKKLYLYTDRELSIEDNLNSNTSGILEEIKKILIEDINDDDCISINEIINLNVKMKASYDSFKANSKSNLEHIIQGKYYKPKFEVYDFDYENSIMSIGINSFNKFEKIYFGKNENDIYIVKSDTYRANSILAMAKEELNKLFDEFVKYGSYTYESKRNIESVNSNFLVDINRFNVNVKVPTRNFQLNVNSNGSCFYSSKVSGAVDMFIINEKEILDKLYVKLEDCPTWIRKNINSDIKEYKETKDNTILSRILFPWMR